MHYLPLLSAESMTMRENCMAMALSSKDMGAGIFVCLWNEIKRFMLSRKERQICSQTPLCLKHNNGQEKMKDSMSDLQCLCKD